MLSLIFQGDGLLTKTMAVGPACLFRVGGSLIHEGHERVIVGSYCNRFWEVQDKYFTRYDGNGPVTFHFENAAGEPSESFGPFDYFCGADGVLYAENTLFAKFIEEAQLWHCRPMGAYWPTLVMSALHYA